MVANPVWGSLLDYVGLRGGMLAAVGLWSIASASHALVPQAAAGAFLGFAGARVVLGLAEGATFPGGLRTVTDSLPPDRQSRGLALAFSGGSLGAIVAPMIVVPVALAFGWRKAFLFTGVLGAAWLLLWRVVARPPYLPQRSQEAGAARRLLWPDPRERRFWALACGYALCCLPLGPVLYLSPLYLSRVLGLSDADLGKVLWIPPLGWEVGYFFWGWIADKFAGSSGRPVGLFVLLAVLSLPQAAIPLVHSSAIALALFFWAMFAAGGFVVVSMREGSRDYPQQSALVAGIGSGAWSALVAVVLPVLGRWFDQQRYVETFASVAVVPAVGAVLWWWFSRGLGDDRVVPQRAFD
jgi:ACS family hexuronate transporter-like MFS transporter